MSTWNTASHRPRRLAVWLGVVLSAVLLWSATGWAVSSQLKATLVDRYGNQHEVEKFTCQGRLEIEYYVEDQRRIVPLQDIDRIRFEGERGDEEQIISVALRTGRRETGSILSGGNVAPHQDALGGGGTANRFSGVTKLGPFFILVSDVREVIMRHPESQEPPKELVLKATVITEGGQRFEVENLRYRNQTRLDYRIGRRQRFANLEKVARIDFAEGSSSEEFRPITINYWSGKTVQGTVDASTVRLSGETDKSYFERVNAALTGRTRAGAFSIGLHVIKQIRFHPPEEEAEEEAGEEEGASDEAGKQAPEAP